VFLIDYVNTSTCLLKSNINLHFPLSLIAATITLLKKTYKSTSHKAEQYYLPRIRENRVAISIMTSVMPLWDVNFTVKNKNTTKCTLQSHLTADTRRVSLCDYSSSCSLLVEVKAWRNQHSSMTFISSFSLCTLCQSYLDCLLGTSIQNINTIMKEHVFISTPH
jgi:hypothetical protein